MPVNIAWDDEDKTILVCESEGKWTWDEYHNALDRLKVMAEGVDHRVDLINLKQPTAVMPPGSPMPHFQRAEKMIPANVGMNIVVTRGAFERMMAAVLSKIPGNNMNRIYLANSTEEAYMLIRRDREKVSVR